MNVIHHSFWGVASARMEPTSDLGVFNYLRFYGATRVVR